MKRYWIIAIWIFWSFFWILNGGDKFMNGRFVAAVDPAIAQGVLVDIDTREVTHRLQPMEIQGWYGVNRDAKMTGFFRRLGFDHTLAQDALYTIAILEIILGAGFMALALFSLFPKRHPRQQLETSYSSHLLFASFVLLGIFCVGDIFFGERIELWEHSTFIVLVFMSHLMVGKYLTNPTS